MTQLYRHWDGSDPPQLLYVGIATAASARQMAHARNAVWMKQVRTITVSAPYRTRAEALVAEAEAIGTERPKFNRQHSDDPSQPRLGAYVIADAFEAGRARRRASAVRT
jgi:excinuclease UvrABC nuclease subunit